MEDVSSLLLDSKSIEIWIHRQLKLKKTNSYIADELLKRWEKGLLTLSAKQNVCRFCFQNGFYSAVVRVLRQDLVIASPMPWPSVLEFFLTYRELYSKELLDAVLVGATRDKQLHGVAAQALLSNDPDPRWRKILESELKDRTAEAKQIRRKLFEDLQIFKREGMVRELKENLGRVLSLFPNDPEALAMSRSLDDLQLDYSLKNIRQNQERRKRARFEEEKAEWPQLKTVLKNIQSKLDSESAYNLAIGLHQMGLNEDALQVFSAVKNTGVRETLLQLELLIANRQFAQGLQLSQRLLKNSFDDPDTVHAALYNAAKAYYGLEDIEQAISILKSLLKHRSQYRDAALLLVEWGAQK